MRRALVAHPLLFAVFPVLFIYSQNVGRVPLHMIVVPLVSAIILGLALWSVVSLLLRDSRRAGLIVSLFLLLFFSYGICYLELSAAVAGRSPDSPLLEPGLLLALWGGVLGLGAYAFAKTEKDLHNLTTLMNVVAGCLVLLSILQLGARQLGTSNLEGGESVGLEFEPRVGPEIKSLPDIYYIILDGYARGDVLLEAYDVDNSEFLDQLRERGFFVATESRANYCQTVLSLASSLNLEYLDQLVDRVGVDSPSTGPAMSMIRDSAALRILQQNGYQTIAFASGYIGTEIRTVDMYLSAGWYPDEFQVALINMTPIPFFAKSLFPMTQWHRERILYTLEHISEVSEPDRPTFVFAHIVSPHPPFVFGRHGEELDPEYQFVLHDGNYLVGRRGFTREEYVHGYREQLAFINGRVLQLVDDILAPRGRPAVIILQADHGPGSMLNWGSVDDTNLRERFSILNAYYLPGDGSVHLYDAISPVNSFRVIFNLYLHGSYDLLPDESYFSTVARPYDLTRVTDALNSSVEAYPPD